MSEQWSGAERVKTYRRAQDPLAQRSRSRPHGRSMPQESPVIQAARQYRDTRSSNRPGLVLLRCLMGPGDKDREGRTHLRTRRIGRSRSAACRAGHGVDGGWLVLGPPQPSSGSRTIVAGYDGTAVGREAVVQAGLQAGPTGCVFVVYAYGSPGSRFGRVRRLKAAWAAGRRALEDLFNDGSRTPITSRNSYRAGFTMRSDMSRTFAAPTQSSLERGRQDPCALC